MLGSRTGYVERIPEFHARQWCHTYNAYNTQPTQLQVSSSQIQFTQSYLIYEENLLYIQFASSDSCVHDNYY